MFFPHFRSPFLGFCSVAYLYRAASYRCVFSLPFRQFVFASIESTIFVASVKSRATYPRLQAHSGTTLIAPLHFPWTLSSKVACWRSDCIRFFCLRFTTRPLHYEGHKFDFSAAKIGRASTAPSSFVAKAIHRFFIHFSKGINLCHHFSPFLIVSRRSL